MECNAMNDFTSLPDILAQAEIFRNLDRDQLELVGSICLLQEYNAGDTIFEENSASQELYIIADGEIDIQVDPSSIGEEEGGGLVTITTLRRGQSFGEMALVDLGLRSATASCAQHETMVVLIPREGLIQLCENYPHLGYVLMRNLAIDMAAKIRATGVQMREWATWVRGATPL
jgi:CRP-like cAMP-binding protein